MADLLGNIVKDVVEGVLKEILKKSTRSGTTRRRKRQTRSATTGRFVRKTLDPVTGEAAAEPAVRKTGGGHLLYRMHYMLHYVPYDVAIRLVGVCTMLMLMAILTGVITHKKIFADFFTFRPGKGQRSWLDGHNAIGVLVLPFHLMISYSSLVLFMYMVMPAGIMASYGGNSGEYFNELFGRDDAPKAANVVMPLVPLPTLYAKVQEQVPGARIGYIQLQNPGDRNARVAVVRAQSTRVSTTPHYLLFDDTVEHAAWNDSDHLRVVLIFDVWHPMLTATERQLVKESLEGIMAFYGQDAPLGEL